MRMFNKLRFILTNSEKKRLAGLSFGSLILALSETMSIGIVIPIMNVFINQEKIQTSKILQWFYRLIGAEDNVTFLTVLIITAIILFVLKSVYGVFILYKQRSVVSNIRIRLTTKLLTSYLDKPYSFHLENNSAVLFRNVTTSVANFSHNFLFSLVLISAEIIVLFSISCLLIYLYPVVALLLVCTLTAVMTAVTFFLKKGIRAYSSQRMEASEQVHKFGLEALQAVKEIKAYNAQTSFIERYSQAAKKYADSFVKFNVASIVPRYILETILITSVFIALLMSTYSHKAPTELIPMMTAFGLAALRVLPSINRVYTKINSAKYYSNSCDIVYKILKEHSQEKRLEKVVSEDVSMPQESQTIRLENVDFRYKTAPSNIFNEFNLVIPRYKTVAFAGETGAGKSTLIDILMGLLIPANGALYYGQEIVTPENVLAYRRKISYVPQEIFLTDDTLEANIAFGIPRDKIGHEQLKRAIQISQLQSMINDLSEGTKTIVGEKGVRLSGGQRQRIAIARALYRNPEIIIFDEATSALDRHTESKLYNAIKDSKNDCTIIFVTHRVNTLEHADYIYVMDSGKIVGQGSFKALWENSEVFRKIIHQPALSVNKMSE